MSVDVDLAGFLLIEELDPVGGTEGVVPGLFRIPGSFVGEKELHGSGRERLRNVIVPAAAKLGVGGRGGTGVGHGGGEGALRVVRLVSDHLLGVGLHVRHGADGDAAEADPAVRIGDGIAVVLPFSEDPVVVGVPVLPA